jgi:hypothetical protein
VADAHVEAASPTTNFGTASRMGVDSSSAEQAYLSFNVTGLSGTVVSATLRVYVTNSTSDAPQVYRTDSFSESGITWSNHPTPTGAVLDDKGAVSTGWVEYNVTAAVTGNGTYNFVFVATSSDGMDFYSREGTFAPELVITVAS